MQAVCTTGAQALASVNNLECGILICGCRFMDMMYMPDALNAAISLMEAAPARLKHRNAFNIASMSFDPEQIYQEIKKHMPDFEMAYEIDPLKQAIADSWPDSLDDSCAREEWDWMPQYDLESMTVDMLEKLRAKLNK